jgi:drug/metabolite transporter (DMT)-like permease
VEAPLRAWLPAFIVMALGWGSSFFFISLALEGFDPRHVGFGRNLVGAVVLVALVLWLRKRPSLSWRNVAAIAVVGACLSGIPMVLIPMAQQQITSILASLLNATTPLWTALFVALLIPAERISRVQWAGLVVGALGIAVLVGAWDVDSFSLAGTVLMLIATLLYGVGSTLSRVLLAKVQESATTLSAVQMGLSALMLAPFALMAPAPEREVWSLTSSALWGLLLLGVMGSSFAYLLFWRVVKVAGATTAASVTYVVPIVALILGLVVLKEQLHWYEPVGAAIVFAGVALAQRKRKALTSVAAPIQVAAVEDPAEPSGETRSR